MASSSSIELKVLYAQGLKVYNYFQKPVVFVQVSLAVDDPGTKLDRKQQQIQRTTTVREDDGQPEWNQDMRFDLSDAMLADRDHLFVQFDLRHEGLVFGDKPIGEIRVPFTDLSDGGSTGIVRFVSYEVRTPEGKPNGALNFSYKLNLNGGVSPAERVSGYPVIEHDPIVPYPTPDVLYPAMESGGFGFVAEESPRGQDGYYTYPYPYPMGNAAVVGHHHHHGPPPPPPHRVHPWAEDPRRHHEYGPRRWAPGSGPWASWNGR